MRFHMCGDVGCWTTFARQSGLAQIACCSPITSMCCMQPHLWFSQGRHCPTNATHMCAKPKLKVAPNSGSKCHVRRPNWFRRPFFFFYSRILDLNHKECLFLVEDCTVAKKKKKKGGRESKLPMWCVAEAKRRSVFLAAGYHEAPVIRSGPIKHIHKKKFITIYFGARVAYHVDGVKHGMIVTRPRCMHWNTLWFISCLLVHCSLGAIMCLHSTDHGPESNSGLDQTFLSNHCTRNWYMGNLLLFHILFHWHRYFKSQLYGWICN